MRFYSKLMLCVVILLGLAGTSSAFTFNIAGDPADNVDIPAFFIPLNVSQTGIITDFNLQVSISPPFADDLNIFLLHNGTTVQAYQGPRQNDPNSFIDQIFPLAAFNGMELAGLWQLEISDTFIPGDGNTLNSWSIQGTAFNPVPEPSTFLLLGAGLIGVGLLGRRSKR